jgi:hypothetical protein
VAKIKQIESERAVSARSIVHAPLEKVVVSSLALAPIPLEERKAWKNSIEEKQWVSLKERAEEGEQPTCNLISISPMQ